MDPQKEHEIYVRIRGIVYSDLESTIKVNDLMRLFLDEINEVSSNSAMNEGKMEAEIQELRIDYDHLQGDLQEIERVFKALKAFKAAEAKGVNL